MGVPKFYRWISERYPKINQIVSDNALLPEVDHLYLDLNGIIHGCTHPAHLDVSDVLSERDMILGIMQYLDRIITQIVKPQISVYMAIDGVAPRAKLNQQRSRRFRSAKDLAEATKDLPPSDSAVFDSNCITPGTEFLKKVSDWIQYFIRKKLKEDPLWHGLSVIFSGHDIPGEGEHKIMQHIREMRSSPHYQPNTRHCIYGQDADLIMLGLVTHEPHFAILREVVDFNSFQRNKNTLKAVKKFTKGSDFQLLHLSVLREYLQIEFCKDAPQDLERIIDDFVFMTFLVGNDFLPHSPTLDIGDGAFDLLFDIYREQRPTWGPGEYLTQSGRIPNPARLEAFLAKIGAVENEILEQREKNDAEYTKKRRKWDKRDGKPQGPSDAELKQAESEKQNDYLSMIEAMMANTSLSEKDYVDGWKPVIEAGQKDFKGRYYFEKLQLKPVDKDEHWRLRKSFMEGLMWCLAYYYEGCISWGWFFPYHYGPMLSDLIDLPRMFSEIKFEPGEPLTPFQQLMGCLPPASSALVPPLYRSLMTSPDSPIIQFYPADFEVDMNGKRNPWEGVNLLPFIDIQLLKDTIAKYCPSSKLSPDERERNQLGKIYCYRFDASCNDLVEPPSAKIGLPEIVGCQSSVSIIDKQESTGVPFKPELIPGTQIPYPGFPSLNVLPIAAVELTKIGLNCFGSPSKYPNTLLTLHQMPELPPIEVLAENVLGKSLFINWPMMHEARVVAISDETKEIRLTGGARKVRKFNDVDTDRWHAASETMFQMYYTGNGVPGSGGVNIGDVKVRLKMLPLQGMKMNPANGSKKKLFGKEEADVPLQLALWQAPAPDPRFVERGPMTLGERFPAGCNVVLTKGKYRGCKGTVVGVADQKSVGVKVQTIPAELPFGLAIARSVQESFISSVDAARILKMNPGIFGKITGRLQFEQDKYDLGLNLKSADGLCVLGYTRKKVEQPRKGQKGSGQGKPSVWDAGDSLLVIGSTRSDKDDDNEERIQWEYTPKAIRLVETYRQQFPQLFAALKKNPNEKRYDAKAVFGPNGEAWLPVVREWLDKHESARLPRSPVTSNAMSYEAVAAVQKAADVRTLALKKRGFPKESLIKIPGNAMYREGSTGATDVLLASDLNDNEAPELGDRVVNLCADGIPFGARGTVVGIHQAATTGSVEVVMDEEFIGGSNLQGACSNFRGKLCLWAHLLKVVPENSQGLVDKLVPKGSSRIAVDRIISKLDYHEDSGAPMKSSWDSNIDSEPQEARSANTTPARVQRPSGTEAPRADSRARSAGRGRQGAWREAKGPDEKGNGFKGVRKGQSGFAQWKKLIKSGQTGKSTAELKAVLGVGKNATQDPGANSTTELKAILGVSKPDQTNQAAPSDPDTSANLKAILGVNSGNSGQIPAQQHQVPPQQATPSAAADKLLQLMANKQAPTPAMMPQPQSAFNFTYVEEGKEAPPPTVVPQPPPPPMPYPPPPHHPYPHPQMHPGFMPPMPAGPVPPYGIPPHGYPMPPPPGAPHPPYGAPTPPRGPPPGGPVPGAANVSNMAEFPPLGAEPPKKAAKVPPPQPKAPEQPAQPQQEAAKAVLATAMVPSVVAAKSSR